MDKNNNQPSAGAQPKGAPPEPTPQQGSDEQEEHFATLEELGRVARKERSSTSSRGAGIAENEERPFIIYEKDTSGIRPIAKIKKPHISNIESVKTKKTKPTKAKVELPEE